MSRLGITTSVAVITSVFIYAMLILSADNKCSGVRIYSCQNDKNLVSDEKYKELKPTGDIFLRYCDPEIKEEDSYLVDYSSCNLKVSIAKEKSWVNSVEVNGTNLNREQINSNF